MQEIEKIKEEQKSKYFSMGIVVIGDVFIDIKGYSVASYIPQGRNVGTIAQIHGGVGRNVAEDIANLELKPTFRLSSTVICTSENICPRFMPEEFGLVL